MAQPCRNFCILGQVAVKDPADGREKLVLSNFSAGETGSLIFVDPETGEGEQIPLPGDSGAWALLPLEDGRLLVGTCEEHGYLHSLRMADRTWEPPLRLEGETYIWNLVLGSDGMVYGGTYPGCLLVRYDPVGRTLESAGRMSGDPGNLYCRAHRILNKVNLTIIMPSARMHMRTACAKRGAECRFRLKGIDHAEDPAKDH